MISDAGKEAFFMGFSAVPNSPNPFRPETLLHSNWERGKKMAERANRAVDILSIIAENPFRDGTDSYAEFEKSRRENVFKLVERIKELEEEVEKLNRSVDKVN